jgi:hypothetical protein
MKISLNSLISKSKIVYFSLRFRFFACFFALKYFFRFILGLFSQQKTFFASLRNEAKQTLFFAISLPFFRFRFASSENSGTPYPGSV